MSDHAKDDKSRSTPVAEIYAEAVAGGFAGPDGKTPLRWLTSLAEQPSILAGNWQVGRELLLRGEVPRRLKHLILLAMSERADSGYWRAHHAAALRALGVSDVVIDEARRGTEPGELPEKERAAFGFAMKAAGNPKSITDADVDGLRRYETSDGELVELGILVAFGALLNSWAAVSGISAE